MTPELTLIIVILAGLTLGNLGVLLWVVNKLGEHEGHLDKPHEETP